MVLQLLFVGFPQFPEGLVWNGITDLTQSALCVNHPWLAPVEYGSNVNRCGHIHRR